MNGEVLDLPPSSPEIGSCWHLVVQIGNIWKTANNTSDCKDSTISKNFPVLSICITAHQNLSTIFLYMYLSTIYSHIHCMQKVFFSFPTSFILSHTYLSTITLLITGFEQYGRYFKRIAGLWLKNYSLQGLGSAADK